MWYGKSLIVHQVHNVAQDDIARVADEMYAYSQQLLPQSNKMYQLRYLLWDG